MDGTYWSSENIIKHHAIEVVSGIYQITNKGSNAFLFLGDKLALIDTCFRSSALYIYDIIQQLGRSIGELDLVILTHNHLDHTGGVEELRQYASFKIAAHKADFENESSIFPYSGGKIIKKMLSIPILSSLRRRLLLDLWQIDMILEDKQILLVNGGLQVIFTPGHTGGSICLYSLRHKILFVGDALNKRHGTPSRSLAADYTKALESIYRIAELDVNILCFGHGKFIKTGGGWYLQNLVKKLKQMQT